MHCIQVLKPAQNQLCDSRAFGLRPRGAQGRNVEMVFKELASRLG